MGKRMAVARVSRQLIEDLTEPVKFSGCVACALHGRKDWLHAALKLPANARIDAMSYDFYMDQVLLRIECPDFREVAEGESLPEVEAMYWSDDRIIPPQLGVFARWRGPAVEPPKQGSVTVGGLVMNYGKVNEGPASGIEAFDATIPAPPDTDDLCAVCRNPRSLHTGSFPCRCGPPRNRHYWEAE